MLESLCLLECYGDPLGDAVPAKYLIEPKYSLWMTVLYMSKAIYCEWANLPGSFGGLGGAGLGSGL